MSHKNENSHGPCEASGAGPRKRMWEQLPSAVRLGATRLAAMLLTLVAISIGLAATSPFGAFAQKPAPAKPVEDLPAGAMQAKATTSCLECHEARIILQQRLSKSAWAKEVDKMVKWGAVVEAIDHDALVDYLSIHFNPDQAPYEPSRTSLEKTSRKNGEKKSSN